MNRFSSQDTWVSGDVRVLRMRPIPTPQPPLVVVETNINKVVGVCLHYSPAEYWVTQGHKLGCFCSGCRYSPLGGGNALEQIDSAEMTVEILTSTDEELEFNILRYRRELMSILKWKRITVKRVGILQRLMARSWVGQDLNVVLQAGIDIVEDEIFNNPSYR